MHQSLLRGRQYRRGAIRNQRSRYLHSNIVLYQLSSTRYTVIIIIIIRYTCPFLHSVPAKASQSIFYYASMALWNIPKNNNIIMIRCSVNETTLPPRFYEVPGAGRRYLPLGRRSVFILCTLLLLTMSRLRVLRSPTVGKLKYNIDRSRVVDS